MSNIATKLTYLNGTKQAIKQAINEDFEVIDDNTTFREYAEEISYNNAKYKDLIPKETKNATNTLDISNSSGLDKALVTQYGNTYQETTTGKNLYSGSNVLTDRFTYIIPSKIGETYTLSFKGSTTETGGSARVFLRNCNDIEHTSSIDNQFISLTSTMTNYSLTLTPTRNGYLFMVIAGSVSNFTFENIMLEKGSTATSYEPYTNGTSPNPDYPQEIVNISGKSNVKVIGKNLFDNVYGQTGNVYTKHINAPSPLGSVDCYPINLSPNTQYTLKIDMNGYQKTGAWIAGVCFENGDVISLLQLNSMADITTTTFTTDSTGVVYVGQRYGFTYGETGRMDLFLQTAKIQLEKGSTATTYEPYQEQSFDLDLKSKNLFDSSLFVERTVSGITLTKNNDGTITLNGTSTARADFTIIDLFSLTGDNKISSINRISGENTGNVVFGLYDMNWANGKQCSITSSTDKGSISLESNRIYTKCFIRIETGITLTNLTIGLQIKQGSTATNFEPYYDISLCKIDTYKDRIYPLNGKWYLEKKINKVVLNGSESWTLPQTNTNTLRFNCEQGLINGLDASIIKIISNKFVNGKAPSDNDDYEHIRSAVKGYPNMIAICINKSRLSSQNIDGFKTWLSNNNVTVYYIATPTTTEITESNYPTLYEQLNNIKLYEGVNHITMTNESGLDVEFDIEYYKDWKVEVSD